MVRSRGLSRLKWELLGNKPAATGTARISAIRASRPDKNVLNMSSWDPLEDVP